MILSHSIASICYSSASIDELSLCLGIESYSAGVQQVSIKDQKDRGLILKASDVVSYI